VDLFKVVELKKIFNNYPQDPVDWRSWAKQAVCSYLRVGKLGCALATTPLGIQE